MNESNYFSRDNYETIAILEGLHRGGIFFIEERGTQMWVEREHGPNFNGDFKTNVPTRAMRFNNKFEAMTYMIKFKLKQPEWYVTEHEFTFHHLTKET